MSRILLTGIVTLDILNYVDHYPVENEELRAHAQIKVTGGNAANTACILAQLNHQVELAGVLSHDRDGTWLRGQLQLQKIGLNYSTLEKGHTPTSCIIINQQNGSRTISHYRDLVEYTYDKFCSIPVSEYDWLHFEGRNISELEKMLASVNKQRIDQTLSLEIEKERNNIDSLFPQADVLLFSHQFAQGRGYNNAKEFLLSIAKTNPQAIHVCTWGEHGAWARDPNGDIIYCPAFNTGKIIDTRAAGDTFNAGLIHAFCSGQNLEEALQTATQLAGKKVTQYGLDNLIN
ncbi:MAG: PfkB family carbohydrate kinase [Gammaproteobacteria bacterium]|nr:PfkB family carbohydrate kinase [Gammaproteobacteria bacterium]